jgi:hypothetical protein
MAFEGLNDIELDELLPLINQRIRKLNDLPDTDDFKTLAKKDLMKFGQRLEGFEIPHGHVMIIKAIKNHIKSKHLVEESNEDIKQKFLEAAMKLAENIDLVRERNIEVFSSSAGAKWKVSCPFCQENVGVSYVGKKPKVWKFKKHLHEHLHPAGDGDTTDDSDVSQSEQQQTSQHGKQSQSSSASSEPPKKRRAVNAAPAPRMARERTAKSSNSKVT